MICNLSSENDVCVGGGPAYEINTEDGVETTYDWLILVCVSKKTYVLNHSFKIWQKDAANLLAQKIREFGRVNLENWSEWEYMSLEDKFDLYAQHEYEVNNGFRDPRDLYHGIPL